MKRVGLDVDGVQMERTRQRIEGVRAEGWTYASYPEIEKDLRHQTQMHKTLMHISASCINIPLGKVRDAVQGALVEIGKFISADRAYIFIYACRKNDVINIYEWCIFKYSEHDTIVQ